MSRKKRQRAEKRGWARGKGLGAKGMRLWQKEWVGVERSGWGWGKRLGPETEVS